MRRDGGEDVTHQERGHVRRAARRAQGKAPWAGPVFVCHGRCGGYQTPGDYPPDLRGRFSLLSPFDHTGARAYQDIKFVEPGDDYPAAVAMVMAQPEVAYLDVRSATAQCFTFEVRPA